MVKWGRLFYVILPFKEILPFFLPDGVLWLGDWDILGCTLWEFSIPIEDGSFIDD
jgi:hypothetical protein